MDSLANSEWYVLTKLHPPLVRSHTIRRFNLEQTLSKSVSAHALTLISAPAGYGKTTLLASLPALLPNYPLAWITLDVEDNDPVRFVGLLASAMQRLHPQCGNSVWTRISGGINSDTDIKKAVVALLNDVVKFLKEPFLLILDDLHFVSEPLIYLALDYLLEKRPPNLRVAIGTRTDPALRLNRLAARGQLAELRRSDLSLNLEQSQELLNDILQLKLSRSEVATLQERTEGWAGVLCLLAGPLGRMGKLEDRLQFLATLNHSERQVFEFLAEEILLDLPEHFRAFLLKTSILTEVTPEICNAVTGREDSDTLLAELYRRNLAIAAIAIDKDGEPVYRYHALFSKMLNEQLRQEKGIDVDELHRKAAAVQKTPGRAILHYLAAGLWDQVAQLIVRHGMAMLHQGMAETIRKWYNCLPQEVQDSYPRLTILMARCEIHRGDYDSAGQLLKEAISRVGGEPEEGEALTSLITLAYHRGDRLAVAGYVERALKLTLDPVAQVAVRLASAWLHLYDCNWAAVCANVRGALEIPSSTSDRRADLIGITYTTASMATLADCMPAIESYCAEVSESAAPDTAWYLGAQELGTWPLLWRGQIDAALVKAENAETLRQRLGGYPFVGNDLPVQLGILYLAKGDSKAAAAALDSLLQRLDRVGHNKAMLHVHAAGRSSVLLGRWNEAATLLSRLESLDDGYKLTKYLVQHLRGLFALLRKQPDQAVVTLQEAIELEDQLPTAHVGGSARLLWASLLIEQGKPKTALGMAEPVLQKWNSTTLLGYALVDGPVIWPLLRLASDSNIPGAASVLKLLKQNVERTEILPEPISPRELEVLRLLMEGYTNRQISEKLYVSAETVKSHVASIFRKLGVNSRTQAALQAREMNL